MASCASLPEDHNSISHCSKSEVGCGCCCSREGVRDLSSMEAGSINPIAGLQFPEQLINPVQALQDSDAIIARLDNIS